MNAKQTNRFLDFLAGEYWRNWEIDPPTSFSLLEAARTLRLWQTITSNLPQDPMERGILPPRPETEPHNRATLHETEVR